jgi:hypothetical protein
MVTAGRSTFQPSRRTSTGAIRRCPRRGLFVQLVMLAQLCGDRVGHYLAAVDLRRLASIDRGVPSRLGIGMNCYLEIAGADPQFTISSSSAAVFLWLSMPFSCE